MIRKGLILLLIPIFTCAQAQTGIGTTSPNFDAALEISSSVKGLLVPRVPLEAINLPNPLSAHVQGMRVYNTATAGTGPNAVSPGEYYNNGSKWIRILTDGDGMDATNDAWVNDSGNADGGRVKLGTKSDGTTRANGTEMVVKDDGKVGIGTVSPLKTLHVKGQIQADSTISAPNYTANVQTISGTWDMRLGADASWTLSSGSNALTINNSKPGMFGLIRLVNSGSSMITLPSGSKVINNGNGSVMLTQEASAVDILTFYYDGTSYWWTYGNNYN